MSEEPTPRRLADARRRGLVAQSPALRGGLALAATFAALVALAPAMVGQLTQLFVAALSQAPRGAPFGPMAELGLESGVRVLAVPLATACVATVIVGWLQNGGLWFAAPLASNIDLGRRSSLPALRRLWGRAAMGQVGLGMVKIAIIAGVAGLTLWPLVPSLVRMAGAPAGRVLAGFGVAAQHLGGRVVAAVLLIGAADYALARWRHRRALRMTRQEVKREQKEIEGDPIHEAERRRLYRDLLETSATGDVDADVDIRRANLVITGGVVADTIAVALRYDRAGARAPTAVATGRRLVAARIADVARAARVPIFHDGALAESLRDLANGDEIPEESYDRVAQLLSVTSDRRSSP